MTKKSNDSPALAAAPLQPENAISVIDRWIGLVENPEFGSVPSKKTLLELLGYVRQEIVAGAAPSSVQSPDELEHVKSQRDYLQRVCSKIQDIVDQSGLPDRSSELDVLPSSVAILEARASSPSSATEQPQFYIQDSRTFTGNSVMWWRPDGNGYTSDLSKAWRVDETKAKQICRSRPTDKMWPCDEIDRRASRQFDMQLFRELSAGTPEGK